MRIKSLQDEDFVNYKKPSMFICTASCGGKCCKELNLPLSICQNDGLRSCPSSQYDDIKIIFRYLSNPITKAIVFGGLEPFEQYDELADFIQLFRNYSDDDVVIYTGYNENELKEQIKELSQYGDVIVKFGRFVPDQKSHYDEILGVNLVSDNQYAKRI